jgi:hypothetical protein
MTWKGICKTETAVVLAWGVLGAALLAGAFALCLASPLFEWHREVADMPAAALGVGLAVAGAIYGLLIPLIGRTLALTRTLKRRTFWAAALAGASVRALLAFSEPAMEDDYYRYLWEGALTAHLVNPYKITPEEARRADPASAVGVLARQGEAVLLRVNHPGMTSNYPPLAQLAFAAAYQLAPWDLSAWRVLALAFDAASFLLLLALLGAASRDRLWSLLYWWNPIVIKEVANSAHMDGLVVMLVLASLLMAARRRRLAALIALSLAMGAKLWPALLLPLLLRPLATRPWTLAAGGLLVAAAAAAWAIPVSAGGPHPHDGFIAFARFWRTNSALFPAVEDLIAWLLEGLGQAGQAWLYARLLLVAGLGALAIHVAWRPVLTAEDLCRRAGLVTLWLVLLSPAQFPWYVMWTIPFAVFRPTWSVAAMTALVPLYYLSFYFIARGQYGIFSHAIVWAIWCPVWLAVAVEAVWSRRQAA